MRVIAFVCNSGVRFPFCCRLVACGRYLSRIQRGYFSRAEKRFRMKNISHETRLQAPVPNIDTEAVAAPKRKKYKRTELDEDMYLQPEEIRALFDCIESRRDRAIFRVVYHHGLRAHEVGLPDMNNYRDRDGLLYIRRGKGSISREHRLIPEEIRAIRAYIK